MFSFDDAQRVDVGVTRNTVFAFGMHLQHRVLVGEVPARWHDFAILERSVPARAAAAGTAATVHANTSSAMQAARRMRFLSDIQI
jgi:hypothetical protein